MPLDVYCSWLGFNGTQLTRCVTRTTTPRRCFQQRNKQISRTSLPQIDNKPASAATACMFAGAAINRSICNLQHAIHLLQSCGMLEISNVPEAGKSNKTHCDRLRCISKDINGSLNFGIDSFSGQKLNIVWMHLYVSKVFYVWNQHDQPHSNICDSFNQNNRCLSCLITKCSILSQKCSFR